MRETRADSPATVGSPSAGACDAGQAPESGKGLRRAVGLGGGYSTEVPQQLRIWRDAHARPGTVTCGDGRRWTRCLLFASRRSGVRVPLAPQVRSKIRNHEPIVQGKYSSKVQQPGPHEIPHTRSSWALLSRAAAHRSQVFGAEFRATEQEERLWEGPVPLARRPAGDVPNLPFQGWFLPLIQRVSEWQPICVTCGYVFS
jgi:hypothetical protein